VFEVFEFGCDQIGEGGAERKIVSRKSSRPCSVLMRSSERSGRSAIYLFGSSEEIVGAFRLRQLAKFEAAREDESATRAGRARWKVLGHLEDAWPCIIQGLELVYSVWLPW
jgi:hypothetical protein